MPVWMIRTDRARRMRSGRGSPIILPRAQPRGFRFVQRGQASLEMLIVLIFLIPLIFGAIELSRGVAVKSSLDSGVGLAVRALSVDPGNWTWAVNAVTQTVAENVFGTAGLSNYTFSVFDASNAPLTQAEFAALAYGAPFSIEATVEYAPDIPLLDLTPPAFITLKARHFGVVERVN